MNHIDISTTQGYREDKTEDELLSLLMEKILKKVLHYKYIYDTI